MTASQQFSGQVPLSRRPSPVSRVAGLDAARVFATLGIVWVHVAEIQKQPESLSTLGRFGTSFYTLAALFLSSRAYFLGSHLPPAAVVRRRAKRLLMPYLIWSVLYAVFYFVTMYPQGQPVEVITRYWGPLFGTSPHLWFLPFAFCAGALASYVVPWLMKWPSWLLLSLGSALSLCAYVIVHGTGGMLIPSTLIETWRLHRLERWLEETPLVCAALFGLSLYGKHMTRLGRVGHRSRMRVAWVALGAFMVIQVTYAVCLDDWAMQFGSRVRFVANVAGAAWLVVFVAARDGKWIKKIAPYGRATYFAYLSHQMILDALKRALTFVPGYGQVWFAVASTGLIFFTAVSLGRLVARVRLLRWLSP
jgi:fucose 4-O-acetylase-like acetyltransferase